LKIGEPSSNSKIFIHR